MAFMAGFLLAGIFISSIGQSGVYIMYATNVNLVDLNWLYKRLITATRQVAECLEWTGNKKDGYGIISLAGRKCRVHRFEWERQRGPIPDGFGVLHSCDNRACRNINHLSLVMLG